MIVAEQKPLDEVKNLLRDSKKVLVWIWNPDMIERLEKQGLIIND